MKRPFMSTLSQFSSARLAMRCFCGRQIVGILLVISGLFVPDFARANDSQSYPYQATIFTDDVEVHSGPGSRFYVTGKLKKGEPVHVHRHDPGGWYMISPPAGSFSLVRTEYVKKENPRSGVITENNVIVRVGSTLNDHTEVEQRRLMKGDRVAILGEMTCVDQGRSQAMIKIEPPRGEFRWVKGDFIVPVDPNRRKVQDSNPYSLPSNAVEINKSKEVEKPRQPDFKYPIADAEPKRTRPAPDSWDKASGAVAAPGFDAKLLEKDRQILDALDRNFREMIDRDIATWNLRDLMHDYRKLQAATKIEPIANQIDLRLQAVERYRKIKAEYDDLVMLTSATDRRDASLLSLQKETQIAGFSPFDAAGQPDPDRMAYDSRLEQEAQLEFLPDLGPLPGSASTPAPAPPTGSSYPAPQPQGSYPYPPQPPRVRSTAPWGPGNPVGQPGMNPSQAQPGGGYSGAGIVKKVGRPDGSTPAYVLVTPEDRLLAYLDPAAGVNLEFALGQSVGVHGQRFHAPRLQADVITVVGFAFVRLSPSR